MAKLAPSLSLLFRELNARWPRRDHRTDGWYASPRVRRSIGHNPGRGGFTHAIDVDDDGIDEMWIINHIYKRDRVLWYIIWNRTLYSATYGWRPRRYTGFNPHTDHMHIEIYQTVHAENYRRGWGIAPGTSGFGPAPGGGGGTSGFGAAPGFDPDWGDRDYRASIDANNKQVHETGNSYTRWSWVTRDLRKR